MTNRRRLLVLAGIALASSVVAPAAFAQTKLIGTVGANDSFTITLTHENGTQVGDIPAGTYEIEVRDRSALHNFHLTGPGVDLRTDVDAVETVTWTVTFQDRQRYRFLCDPHAGQMTGTFTIGGGPPTPPPPPAPRVETLTATVGPGNTISLRGHHGRVRSLKAGRYRIVVRDRSATQNFHLYGPGLSRKTTARFRGTVTWTVTFRKGRTYRFVSDRAAKRLKGSFRAT
jgi:hypothetical protein